MDGTPMTYYFIAQSGGRLNTRMLANVGVPAMTNDGVWASSAHEFSGVIDLSGMLARHANGNFLATAGASSTRTSPTSRPSTPKRRVNWREWCAVERSGDDCVAATPKRHAKATRKRLRHKRSGWLLRTSSTRRNGGGGTGLNNGVRDTFGDR